MVRPSSLVLAASSIAVACGGDLCDGTELTDALASAQPGDTVTVGNCIVSGNFVVPSGVTLAGLASGQSRLTSAAATVPLVVLETAPGETTKLEDLSLQSLGRAAVLARGEGAIEASRLAVAVSLGFGIGGAIPSAKLTDVTMVGPVTPENASFLPRVVTATDAATYGIAFAGTQVELTSLAITGFGVAGAVLIDSDGSWNGGALGGNHPIGLYAADGTLELSDLAIAGTIQGVRNTPAFGAFFSASDVTSNAVELRDGEGYGFFHLGGSASHLALRGSANANASVWGQSMSSLSVEATIDDNSFAGIVAASVNEVVIRNTAVSRTRTISQFYDTYGMRSIGDGIQLVYPIASANIENVALDDNERVGMLLDLDGAAPSALALTGVTVDVGAPDRGGVVAQNGAPPAGWDSGVTRTGTTDAADRAFRRVEVLGVVGPCDLPRSIDGTAAAP